MSVAEWQEQASEAGPVAVPYMDLGGGLNTRKDPHALNRNELAVSINLWPAYDNAVSKRPGSIAIGNSGSGLPCISLMACRFSDVTYLIEVKQGGKVFAGQAYPGSTFTKIGNVSPTAAFCTAAQMFDPTVGKNGTACVFICDGIAIPQFWAGPGTQLQNVAFGANTQPASAPGWGLPAKPGGITPIAPQYVTTLGNNSHLFYSGDQSLPSAVYISDPFYPQAFNSPAMQVDASGGSRGAGDPFIPAIIGNNDGVEGGAITGMKSLGSAMGIFKECADYAMQMVTLLGEVPAWQVVQVSNSRGCLSPRSIVGFDNFITYLSIDGVYATDLQTSWQISADVPTFFDSTLTGVPAAIANKTTAIGVRHGTRLLLFFQGQNAPITTGVWFEFSQQTSSGMPKAGQMEGMNVGGAVSLTGPHDDGNVCWSDAALDNIGKFGLGYSDLGPKSAAVPITVTMAGKADLMDDVFGPEGVIGEKVVNCGYGCVELLGAPPGTGTQLNFQGAFLLDNTIMLSQSIAQLVAQGADLAGVWGKGQWGSMTWGGNQFYGFALVKMPAQGSTRGHLIQFAMTESSVVPWIMIGYVVYANVQPVNF